MSDCPNDEHMLNTCHCCLGSGVGDDFEDDSPCSRCDGRGHFHDTSDGPVVDSRTSDPTP